MLTFFNAFKASVEYYKNIKFGYNTKDITFGFNNFHNIEKTGLFAIETRRKKNSREFIVKFQMLNLSGKNKGFTRADKSKAYHLSNGI